MCWYNIYAWCSGTNPIVGTIFTDLHIFLALGTLCDQPIKLGCWIEILEILSFKIIKLEGHGSRDNIDELDLVHIKVSFRSFDVPLPHDWPRARWAPTKRSAWRGCTLEQWACPNTSCVSVPFSSLGLPQLLRCWIWTSCRSSSSSKTPSGWYLGVGGPKMTWLRKGSSILMYKSVSISSPEGTWTRAQTRISFGVAQLNVDRPKN